MHASYLCDFVAKKSLELSQRCDWVVRLRSNPYINEQLSAKLH